MIFWPLALLALFHSFHSTTAWNENSALILMDLPGLPFMSTKRFPWVVRESNTHDCIVYYPAIGSDTLITYAYCPAPRPSNVYCNYAPSFVTSNYAKGLRPRSICQSPVLYDMIQVRSWHSGHESCRHNRQDGYRFKFVYWRCKDETGNQMKGTAIYNTCYDETNKQIILGTYTLATPSLLANTHLQDQQAHMFEFDDFDYHDDFLNHFQLVARPLYEAESNQGYVRRMVLPPELLPFALQRKPLFHYMNLAPMDASLVAGWEQMMRNLKVRVSKFREAINVTAGLLDTITTTHADGQHYKEYLGYINGSWEIAIPYIWWLLLYNDSNSNGVVIMMHNKPYFTGGGNPNMTFYHPTQCSLMVCGVSNIRDWLPNEYTFPENFIYCCYPHVITKKFGLAGSNELLVFPNMTGG